jgi:hypothetical protein
MHDKNSNSTGTSISQAHSFPQITYIAATGSSPSFSVTAFRLASNDI